MGQSRSLAAGQPDAGEAFHGSVLRGAELLSRQALRQLADDLHALARDREADEGRAGHRAAIDDYGSTVWL